MRCRCYAGELKIRKNRVLRRLQIASTDLHFEEIIFFQNYFLPSESKKYHKVFNYYERIKTVLALQQSSFLLRNAIQDIMTVLLALGLLV